MIDCKYRVDSGNPRKPICTAENARIGTNPHIGVCLACKGNPGKRGIRAISVPERCIHQYEEVEASCGCKKVYCRLAKGCECERENCKDFIIDESDKELICQHLLLTDKTLQGRSCKLIICQSEKAKEYLDYDKTIKTTGSFPAWQTEKKCLGLKFCKFK